MKRLLLVPDTIDFADNPDGILEVLSIETGMVVIVGPEEELDKIRVVGDCEKCDPAKIVKYDPEVHG